MSPLTLTLSLKGEGTDRADFPPLPFRERAGVRVIGRAAAELPDAAQTPFPGYGSCVGGLAGSPGKRSATGVFVPDTSNARHS